MARAHTKLVAQQTFEGVPVAEAALSTAPGWTAIYLNSADWTGTGTAVRFDATGNGKSATYAYTAYTPSNANYSVWGIYGGHASTDSEAIGILARQAGSGISGFHGYALAYSPASNGTLSVRRLVTGSTTVLASKNPFTLNVGDELCLECINDGDGNVVLRAYVNDVEQTAAGISPITDSSADKITAAGSGGIYGITGTATPINKAQFAEWRLYAALPSRRARVLGPLAGRGQIAFALAR